MSSVVYEGSKVSERGSVRRPRARGHRVFLLSDVRGAAQCHRADSGSPNQAVPLAAVLLRRCRRRAPVGASKPAGRPLLSYTVLLLQVQEPRGIEDPLCSRGHAVPFQNFSILQSKLRAYESASPVFPAPGPWRPPFCPYELDGCRCLVEGEPSGVRPPVTGPFHSDRGPHALSAWPRAPRLSCSSRLTPSPSWGRPRPASRAPVDGHRGRLRLLAFGSSAAGRTRVPPSPRGPVSTSFGDIPRSGLAGPQVTLFLVFWGTVPLFSAVAAPLWSLTAVPEVPFSPHPHRDLSFSAFFKFFWWQLFSFLYFDMFPHFLLTRHSLQHQG